MLPALCRFVGVILVSSAMAGAAEPTAEHVAAGEKIFLEKCALCHQPSGLGTPPVYPPLAQSEWLPLIPFAVMGWILLKVGLTAKPEKA